MNSAEQFADRFRLRVKRDSCGDQIIPAKLGHIYEHGPGVFGIILEDASDEPGRARALLARRRKAMAAGFRLHQEGDCESILLFDPADSKQARLAIRLVGARPKRLASPAQLANLQKALGRRPSQAPGATQAADLSIGRRGVACEP